MNPTGKQIAAMAAWTLEDFQNDPLGAVEQVRELAAAYLTLRRERDAAVGDLEELMGKTGPEACEFCNPEGTMVCGAGGCCPKWRGPQPVPV